MKRFMVEGTGVMNGEVEFTNIAVATTLEMALIDTRTAFELKNGKVAGTQITFSGFEQEEFIPKY